jgi:hypothetical protein
MLQCNFNKENQGHDGVFIDLKNIWFGEETRKAVANLQSRIGVETSDSNI